MLSPTTKAVQENATDGIKPDTSERLRHGTTDGMKVCHKDVKQQQNRIVRH